MQTVVKKYYIYHTIHYSMVLVDMKKIEREDWFKQGLVILGNEGFSKVTIDNLCSVMKVTKGSFYHHFSNVDGYIKSLMEYWLQTNTHDFIRESDEIDNIAERVHFLHLKSINAEYGSEQAIRAWGYSNPLVKEYVQKVDTIRLDYLTDLKIKLGEKSEPARRAAMFEMAVLVGLQQLYPDLSKDELVKMFEERYNIIK